MLSRQIIRISVVLAALMLAVPAAAEKEIDTSGLLRSGAFKDLDAHYSEVQHQFEIGRISGDQLRDAFRGFYPTDEDLAVRYDAWVTAYPKSYVARLARGIYYKKVGLLARGEKYISETSQSQIDKMDDAMSMASRDLGASVELNPKPFLSYLHTMDIGRQYISNERLRKVFDRGAELDPNSLGLRVKFMAALEPKWGGSITAMRAFLEESKKTKLGKSALEQLESMVYESEGLEYHGLGNLPSAEAAYRKAIGIGNTCLCVVNDLNKVLFESNQYVAAITLLDDYLQKNPGDLWALANRGSAKLFVGLPQEAIKDWRYAADAGDSYSQNRLGMLYFGGYMNVLRPDPVQSVFWLRKAAAQGESEAQRALPIAEEMAANVRQAH